MQFPPPDHPIWKIAQGIIAVIGITILTVHGADGGHVGGVANIDASDGAGAVGLGTATKIFWDYLRS